MSARNLADASFEPSDEDFRELCAHAAEDARAGHRAAEEGLRERIAAERARLKAERATRGTAAR